MLQMQVDESFTKGALRSLSLALYSSSVAKCQISVILSCVPRIYREMTLTYGHLSPTDVLKALSRIQQKLLLQVHICDIGTQHWIRRKCLVLQPLNYNP